MLVDSTKGEELETLDKIKDESVKLAFRCRQKREQMNQLIGDVKVRLHLRRVRTDSALSTVPV